MERILQVISSMRREWKLGTRICGEQRTKGRNVQNERLSYKGNLICNLIEIHLLQEDSGTIIRNMRIFQGENGSILGSDRRQEESSDLIGWMIFCLGYHF